MYSGELVSVIIPVYNGANYLRDAIECALNQTYQNTDMTGRSTWFVNKEGFKKVEEFNTSYILEM